MQKEKKIKAHTRRTKSGKTITVRAHTAKYDAAEELKKAAKKKGAGDELVSLKSKDATANYEQYGFTKEEFAEWYEGTGSKADKKVEKALRKAMGSNAYNDLSDSAADNYKKGGADSFFKKGIKKMQAATTSKEDSKTQLSEANRLSRKVASLEEKLKQAKYVHSGLRRDDPKKLKYADKIQKLQQDLIATKKASDSQNKISAEVNTEKPSKKLKTQKTLNDYSDEDLDYASKKDIKKVAKVLGLTDVEAASWVIGPNFTAYKESHMKKGEKKAKKYLGKEIFDRLDPSSPDSFRAVLDKATSKATKESTGVIENTPKTKTARKESDNWRKTADIPLRKKGDDAIGSINVGKRTIDVEVSPVNKGYVVSMYDRKNNIGWIADTRITTLSDLSKHIKNRISPKYRRVSRLLESGEIDYDVERIVPKKLKEQEI